MIDEQDKPFQNAMKTTILAAIFLGVTVAGLSMNDALWTGFKYSVSVKYLGIDDEGVDMPQPKSLQMPAYPIGAMKAAASGVVLVSFVVADDGSVREIKIDQANIAGFGDAARTAVEQWTFVPGVLLKDRSKAMPAHMHCRLEFRAAEGN